MNISTTLNASKLLLSIITITAFGFGANAQIPTNGLTGYWTFSGNSNDSSGYANNATITGTVSLTVDRDATLNNAYSFDGTSGYMETNASFAQGAAAKSLSVWFKPDALQRGWIVSGGSNSSGNAFGLFLNSASSGHLNFHGNGSLFDMSLGNIGQANVWTHVVITYDGTTVKGFVDGVNVANSAVTLNTTLSTIIFGGRQGLASNEYFDGDIDDIAIYDRELSQVEVTTLFNEGTVSVDENVSDQLTVIKVFPNPSTSQLTLNTTEKINSINIIDITGKTVKTIVPINNTIDVSDLTKGIYFLQVQTKNGIAKSKFIKE